MRCDDHEEGNEIAGHDRFVDPISSSGSASTNPVLFTLAVGPMLARRVAGYYGLDRYLLPALGPSWRPGALFHRDATTGTSTS